MKPKNKAAKATKKASAKAPKTLGQIAYDSSPHDGGKSNFGPWDKAPQVVRTVHERMAKAVERQVKKQVKDEIRPHVENVIFVFASICDEIGIDAEETTIRVNHKGGHNVLAEMTLAEICRQALEVLK